MRKLPPPASVTPPHLRIRGIWNAVEDIARPNANIFGGLGTLAVAQEERAHEVVKAEQQAEDAGAKDRRDQIGQGDPQKGDDRIGARNLRMDETIEEKIRSHGAQRQLV